MFESSGFKRFQSSIPLISPSKGISEIRFFLYIRFSRFIPVYETSFVMSFLSSIVILRCIVNGYDEIVGKMSVS